VTDAWWLDVVFKPSGTGGYDDLARSAVAYEAFGLEVHAASLEDILRSKLPSIAPVDQEDAIVLTKMLKHHR
jgi:hypothetical protein